MSLFGKSTAIYTPDYGTNVVYLSNDRSKNFIGPKNDPPAGGFFSAEPGGLEIDRDKGIIDLNKSDRGVPFLIKFTDCDKRESVPVKFIISGVNYRNGIYNLDKGQTQAERLYFGRSNTPLPAEGSEFDVMWDDEPTGNRQGLVFVEGQPGVIDLKATVESGALGYNKTKPETKRPENGACKLFKYYYKINDESSKALNYIAVHIHYYDTEADILPYVREQTEWNHKYIGAQLAPLTILLAACINFGNEPATMALLALIASLAAGALFATTSSSSKVVPTSIILVGR